MKWRYWESKSEDNFHFSEKAIAYHKNWVYEITRKAHTTNPFIVFIVHRKLDIRYNSAWSENKKYFKTIEEAKVFCENFDYKKHFCLGDGLKNLV